MTTAIDLSVCIPVYNCGEFLSDALDSILAQCGPGVEVIVYDGGSTDMTPEVMRSHARPGLHYHRAATRGGIDADLASCVSLARGEYCWLFSGDDVMRPGAMAAAFEQISSGADVMVCRHTLCDLKMRGRREYAVLLPVSEPLSVDMGDRLQRHAWFARAATSEAFFSFLSGLIVRRSTWHRGHLEPAFVGSCWAHVVRLLALVPDGLKVAYVPQIWLDQRGENDSFAAAGMVNRFRIAIEGFHAIGDALFGHDSAEAFHMRRVLRFEFKLEMFLVAKILCHDQPNRESRELLDQLFAKLHCDSSIRQLPVLAGYWLTPVWLARALRGAARRVRGRFNH